MSISVLILTLNEELNLPGCLDSVAWCDDVVVFDSLSTDRTCQIAQDFGARVVKRKFDNYAAQRNAALTDVAYKHDWILMVDADERVPKELFDEILESLNAAAQGVTLYRVRRRDMFMGRWIRHSSGYPTWFGRLFRKNRVWVEREINEEYHTDGEVRFLREHLVHYPFTKGISYWFDRHNRYSGMEAARMIECRRLSLRGRDVMHKDPAVRRMAFKQIAYRMPCRPLLFFLYLYFVRMGFLDGRAGFHFSLMRSLYEYMIDLKVIELRRREAKLPV